MSSHYSTSDFHWSLSRLRKTKKQIEEATAVLNTLTPQQQVAVDLLTKSRYEDGCDDAYEEINPS